MARILVLESHPAVSRMLGLQLELLGHEAVSLPPYDLAIVEPAEPGALATAWSLRLEHPKLPLVFVSVRHRTPATAELQPVAHLIKPVEFADLRRALDAALRA